MKRSTALKSSHITLVGTESNVPYVCKSPSNMSARNHYLTKNSVESGYKKARLLKFSTEAGFRESYDSDSHKSSRTKASILNENSERSYKLIKCMSPQARY